MMKIELVNISKSFKEKVVLTNNSMTFNTGKIYGLVGPNGCGKTVLLKLISGLMTPSSGCIKINDQILNKRYAYQLNIGVSIEKPQFVEEISGIDNLEFLASFKKSISKIQILEWLKVFGLEEAMDKPVHTYSLGMKQKLAVIQSLMEDQSIILLDEVSNSLDMKSKKLLFDILKKEVQKNKIIIYVNHNVQEIETLCDEVLIIEEGVLVKWENTNQ